MLASDFYVRDWDQISLNNIVSEFCLKLRMITGERRLRWEGDYGGKGFMARMVITVRRAITVASVTMVVRKTTAGKETIGKRTTVGKELGQESILWQNGLKLNHYMFLANSGYLC